MDDDAPSTELSGPLPWAKVFTELLDDAKLRILQRSTQMMFIDLILVSRENGSDGHIPYGTDELAWRLRREIETVEKEIGQLADTGMIVVTCNDIFVTNFQKRQTMVPSKTREAVAERVRKHRERKKMERNDENVTCNVTCNDAPLQNRYIVTQNRTEQNRIDTPLPPVTPNVDQEDFQRFWEAYPKKKSRFDALWAWRDMMKHLPPLQTLLDAIEIQKRSEDWKRNNGQYIPLASNWLRKELWTDSPMVCVSGDTVHMASPEELLAKLNAQEAERRALSTQRRMMRAQ